MTRNLIIYWILLFGITQANEFLTFESLTRLKANALLGSVEAIHEDITQPGRFILSNCTNLLYLYPVTGRVEQFVGNGSQGYSTGFGADGVMFDRISGFAQARMCNGSGYELMAIEFNYKCVRRVNRQTLEVTMVSGECSKEGRNRPDEDGKVPALKQYYGEPSSIVYNPATKTYFISSHKRALIMEYNPCEDTAEMVYKHAKKFEKPWSMLLSSDHCYLFVSFDFGISKYHISSRRMDLIVGGYVKDEDPNQIGNFTTTTFDKPGGMGWLVPDRVILFADYGNDGLRVIDLHNQFVTAMCRVKIGREGRTITGDLARCQVDEPNSVSVINHTVYIGVRDNRPNLTLIDQPVVQFDFEYPVCIKEDKGNTTSYYLNERLPFSCPPNQGISSSYGSQTCGSITTESGDIVGVWAPENPPSCGDYMITNIQPTNGQWVGGSDIKLFGVFPDEMTVLTFSAGNTSNCVNETCQIYNMTIMDSVPSPKTFQMIDGSLLGVDGDKISRDGVEIKIRSIAAETKFIMLPQPEINRTSRLKTPKSGGVDIWFYGYLKSAYKYSLELLYFTSTYQQDCVVGNDLDGKEGLKCTLPLFDQTKVRRQADPTVKSASLTLYADGKKLITNEDIIIKIYPDPIIYPWRSTKIVKISEEKQIEIDGENLTDALLISDYKVILEPYAINCQPTRITDVKLYCVIENCCNDIQLDIVPTTVKVSAGNLAREVGKLMINNARPKSEFPWWIVVVVILAITLIIFITIVIYQKRVQRNKTRKLLDSLKIEFDESHIGFEQGQVRYSVHANDNEIEENGDPVIRVRDSLAKKLLDLYIDPAKLIHVSKDPIGRGNSGNVYMGKLIISHDDETDEDTVKTVAIKTMKGAQVNSESVESFLEEATLLIGVSHINILTTLGVIWPPRSDPKVILPYMSKGDLCSLLRNPEMKFTTGDLIHFAMQITAGMKYMAEHKLVHRDLAARNCLVDKNFMLRVSDFGMSRDVYTDNYYRESDGDSPRPIRWMAPESLLEGVYTSKADVWSFGVVLWEMFTKGCTPYPGVLNRDVLIHICERKIKLSKPTACDDVIYTAMTRCWNIFPEDRPSFDDLYTLFKHILGITDEHEYGHLDEAGLYVRSYTKNLSLLRKRAMKQKTNQHPSITEERRSAIDNNYINILP